MDKPTYFPRVVVVSLPEAHERRKHIRQEFLKFPHLTYEFFDAIKIRSRTEDPIDYDTYTRKRLFGDDLRPGEVGCFLSHREIWRQCANSTDPAWCILEDDIQLLPEFEQRILLLMEHAKEWDVVRLMQLLPRRKSWVLRQLDHRHVLKNYDRQPAGTQGYLLKPQTAQKLVEHAKNIVWPIDETLDLYWEHQQRLYCLAPAAISLEPRFDSQIGPRVADRRPWWRKQQRQLINGLQGIRRRLYRIKKEFSILN